MSMELLTHRGTKKYLSLGDREVNIVRAKRQRTISHNVLTWLTPKHYPSIFLDQRLRSRFFK